MGLEYFTENNIAVLQKRIQEDLEVLGLKYGIDFNIGSIKYSKVGVDIAISGKLNNEDSKKHIEDEQKRLVDEFCKAREIDSLYNKTFTLGELKVTVVGVNTNRKNTLIVRDSEGKNLNISYSLLEQKS